jgi:hypothetical protein
MLGIAGIGARDMAQIENAAGGSPVQGAKKADDAIDGQNGHRKRQYRAEPAPI